jgi:hypothetical protein
MTASRRMRPPQRGQVSTSTAKVPPEQLRPGGSASRPRSETPRHALPTGQTAQAWTAASTWHN